VYTDQRYHELLKNKENDAIRVEEEKKYSKKHTRQLIRLSHRNKLCPYSQCNGRAKDKTSSFNTCIVLSIIDHVIINNPFTLKCKKNHQSKKNKQQLDQVRYLKNYQALTHKR
jgi:hypothetical protein